MGTQSAYIQAYLQGWNLDGWLKWFHAKVILTTFEAPGRNPLLRHATIGELCAKQKKVMIQADITEQEEWLDHENDVEWRGKAEGAVESDR